MIQDFYARTIVDRDVINKFKTNRSSLFEGMIRRVSWSLLHKADEIFLTDSLELSQAQFFTPDFLSEFQTRRGYDLLPYIALLHEEPRPSFFSPHVKSFGVDASEGRTMAERVQYDFSLTISDLYVDKRLGPMKTWANSVSHTVCLYNRLVLMNVRQIGLNFRNQPYLMAIDAPLAATKVDIVEGEVSNRSPDPSLL